MHIVVAIPLITARLLLLALVATLTRQQVPVSEAKLEAAEIKGTAIDKMDSEPRSAINDEEHQRELDQWMRALFVPLSNSEQASGNLDQEQEATSGEQHNSFTKTRYRKGRRSLINNYLTGNKEEAEGLSAAETTETDGKATEAMVVKEQEQRSRVTMRRRHARTNYLMLVKPHWPWP